MRKCLHEIQLWGIFLINNLVGEGPAYCGWSLPIVGGAIPGLVVLGSIRSRQSKLWEASQ